MVEKIKICTKCNQTKVILEFYKDKSHFDGFSTICKKCKSIYEKGYKKKYRQRPEVKARINERQRKYRQRPEAKARRNAYLKEYRQRPEVKAHARQYANEYNQRPEVKKYRKSPEFINQRKEYNKNPEVINQRKEYNKNPEVIAKKAKYRQHPEVKLRKKEYRKRPEVKLRLLKKRKKQRYNLVDKYVKSLIRYQFGLKSSEIPESLIEFKREQMVLYRELKTFKKGVKSWD